MARSSARRSTPRRGPCGSNYQARLAKIEYEERVAKLVPGDEVQVAGYNKYRQFRDAMLNLPDRLAAMLAAETEAVKVQEALTV
jgi:hypothetical protein